MQYLLTYRQEKIVQRKCMLLRFATETQNNNNQKEK